MTKFQQLTTLLIKNGRTKRLALCVRGHTRNLVAIIYKKNWMHLCLQRPFPFLQHSLDACPCLGTFHHLSHSPQIHTTTQGSFQSGGPPPGFLRCLHLDHAESLKGTIARMSFQNDSQPPLHAAPSVPRKIC